MPLEMATKRLRPSLSDPPGVPAMVLGEFLGARVASASAHGNLAPVNCWTYKLYLHYTKETTLSKIDGDLTKPRHSAWRISHFQG